MWCDGSAVSRSTYSELYTAIGNNFGYGDNSTTFNVPDFRGRFLRGQDQGTARDPDASGRTAMNTGGLAGDNIGSVQDDRFQGHWHKLYTEDWEFSSGTANDQAIDNQKAHGTTDNKVCDAVTDTVNGTPRTSSETRPKNVYVNFIIKY